MKKFTLSIAIMMFLISTFSIAQTNYYTGFDNAAEQAGWQQFRKASLVSSGWIVGAGNFFSAPNSLHHDYAVGGAQTDTTKDWYVSPPFNFSTGGQLVSMKINIFAYSQGFMGIYLLKDAADPALASSITLLADLSSMATTNGIWKDTGNINIPATTGNCYIAFMYKVPGGFWFVPNIDNVIITGNPVTSPTYDLQMINVSPTAGQNLISGQSFNISYQLKNAGITAIPGTAVINLRRLIGGVVQSSANVSGTLSSLFPGVTSLNAGSTTTTNTTTATITVPANVSNVSFCQVAFITNNVDPHSNNDTSCVTVNLKTSASGINDVAVENGVTIYPNPANSLITIKSQNAINGTILMYDMNGKKIVQTEISGTEKTIETNSLSSGIYFYQLVDKKGTTLKNGSLSIKH